MLIHKAILFRSACSQVLFVWKPTSRKQKKKFILDFAAAVSLAGVEQRFYVPLLSVFSEVQLTTEFLKAGDIFKVSHCRLFNFSMIYFYYYPFLDFKSVKIDITIQSNRIPLIKKKHHFYFLCLFIYLLNFFNQMKWSLKIFVVNRSVSGITDLTIFFFRFGERSFPRLNQLIEV